MSFKRTASAVITVALTVGLAGAAAAQRPGGWGGGSGGMRPGGASPRMSNPMGLLQRPEVQTHLQLTLKQKAALGEMEGQIFGSMRQRMGGMMDWQTMRDMTREQRRQRMQEMRPQFEAARTAMQGEMSEKVKAILTPEQAARLHQLDLQRRGPMAMADPKVAEELKVTPAHRAEIGKIVAAYEQETGEVVRTAFGQARESGGQMPDFYSRLSPLRQKLEKSRKDSEAQVQALLSDQEKAAWTTAIGERFTFRADAPPPQQRPGGFRGQRGGGHGQRGGGGQGQPRF